MSCKNVLQVSNNLLCTREKLIVTLEFAVNSVTLEFAVNSVESTTVLQTRQANLI